MNDILNLDYNVLFNIVDKTKYNYAFWVKYNSYVSFYHNGGGISFGALFDPFNIGYGRYVLSKSSVHIAFSKGNNHYEIYKKFRNKYDSIRFDEAKQQFFNDPIVINLIKNE